ncbi:MAG: tetratricopeptide repeat protein [Treponema sp.]|jgi:tetratricopeptide (TPR) repeat protein|nr:tetratricopeptide repeat protein [Treponema sp.]
MMDPILTKAIRQTRRRNFEGAIKTLEVEGANRYHGIFRYYYILAVSCLYVNDFKGALEYFRLARKVKARDPLSLLGLGVLYLRRGETAEALEYYLEAQDLDPKNRIAARALKIIRKYGGQDRLSDWLESGELYKLYPPLPKLPLSPRHFLLPLAGLFAALSILGFLLVQFRLIDLPFRENRTGIAATAREREDRERPVETGGSYRYILTRDQVLNIYDQALSLFTGKRDEAARYNLNRLLESNASEGIKNKCRLVISYLETPGFDTFNRRDNFSYAEVIRDPFLYRDCHIIWRGMATNVEYLPDRTAFDFLVGYETRRTMEGIVRVTFEQAAVINPEKPLEVLGRIVPVVGEGNPNAGFNIELRAVAVHQSGLLPSAGEAR